MTTGDPGTAGGRAVYRIHWAPGTDNLRAVCFCGAEEEFEDPVALWDWLLGHPEGHNPRPAPESGAPVPAAALV
ncbi:hypothetical protein GCM10009530_76130 [Microbispora corallina]|uniref:Uncharacterized protein n=1 Tax=Microbispora corallina TaxID=83302 RepID=A0ABQ4GBN2_9ACTN|nr:hypothetical protein [Microbispora corallina]GIH44472.1 hypothetical protein Mco01_74720 [Microbispora corallina]